MPVYRTWQAELLEHIKSERMNEAFEVQVINNHGSSIRAAFDGAKIEMNLAAYFKKMATVHRRKHPTVAVILTNVVNSFNRRAKIEDHAAERDRLNY